MTRMFQGALFLLALVASPAMQNSPVWAQGSGSGQKSPPPTVKQATFECTTDKDRKTLKATGTNPNSFDQTCSVTCTYTAGDKKQGTQSWSNVLLQKQAVKQFMGGNDGGSSMRPPITNLSAKGSCK